MEVVPSGGVGSSIARYPIAMSKNAAPLATPTVLGVAPYAILGTPVTFRCSASAPAGFTMNVRITDLTAGGAVLGTVSTASASPVALSVVIVFTDATLRSYSVEGFLSGGVPGANDIGYCYGSYVEGT